MDGDVILVLRTFGVCLFVSQMDYDQLLAKRCREKKSKCCSPIDLKALNVTKRI